MNYLPNNDEIRLLHLKYAPSEDAFDFIYTHCQAVWDIAAQLIERTNLPVNREQVKVGCLLHDIGVYRLYTAGGEIDFKNYIMHGILGYELLAEEGFSQAICRFASCHTGVGLTKADILDEALPLPIEDFVATTIEERLVMYADNFHTKSDPSNLRFMSAKTYIEHNRKFGVEHLLKFEKFVTEFGEPDLPELAQKYRTVVI